MTEQFDTRKIRIGVVGLGLMGSSIVVSLLLADHHVIGIAPIPGEKEKALSQIKRQLNLCEKNGLVSKLCNSYLSSLTISDDYKQLKDCSIVLECVIEEIEVKASVYR
jgi:3-hydroxybutyryl-CoA dehydrogenase